MSDIVITPYQPLFRTLVINLSIRAWTPVFEKTRKDVPAFVYEAFYPQGWQARQSADIGTLLDAEPQNFWMALRENTLVGFIGIRIHPEDKMGEINIIAVSPESQQRGIGRSMMAFAEQHIRDNGMSMVMVETVGDSGHAPARHAYESFGFEPWPVARYFKQL